MNYSDEDYKTAKKKLRIMSVSVIILTLITCFVALFCFPPKIVPGILLLGFIGLTLLVVKMSDKALEDVIVTIND